MALNVTARLSVATLILLSGFASGAMGGGEACRLLAPDPVAKVDPVPASPRPRVQIALLLDTSNSMDGLIGQARAQLWNIVCDLAKSKRRGVPPRLEVALYEYGNDGLDADKGFVRRVLPLTDDLDAISEKLFALTTNGGSEFCGKVIADAARDLEWSRDAGDLRMIVIAGNEPFSQGPVDFHASVPAAVREGLIVNTIHCGPESDGVEGGWKLGATLGGGCFSFIDSNARPTHCPTPYDTRIGELGTKLNSTYMPYGGEGRDKLARQEAQDAATERAAPGASVQRAAAKATGLYTNSSWDLIDATKNGKKIESLRDDELPEELRGLKPEERVRVVQEHAAERARIQREIAELEQKRQQFIGEQQRSVAAGPQTWGEALQAAIRKQAAERGYERP